MSDVVKQSGSVIDGLAATATSMSGLSGDITGSLSDVQSSLGDAATTLNASAEKLDSLNKQLTAVVGGSGIPDLSQITSADPYSIATLLSAPVSVNRIALYPVANYGSAMTPFYTVLSIWVGAIILVAMMKVSVSDREKAKVLGLGETLPMGETMGVKDAVIAGRTAGPGAMLDVLRKPRPESPGNARRFGLHPYQEYFGRYAIFGAMALLQGTLVCLGDMFFLGVQCEHPLQFLMVGWLCALVFSLLIYTLTVSFGDIGKAIAVVLLVMQVAGSGWDGTWCSGRVSSRRSWIWPITRARARPACAGSNSSASTTRISGRTLRHSRGCGRRCDCRVPCSGRRRATMSRRRCCCSRPGATCGCSTSRRTGSRRRSTPMEGMCAWYASRTRCMRFSACPMPFLGRIWSGFWASSAHLRCRRSDGLRRMPTG